jgi:hypothetical protein
VILTDVGQRLLADARVEQERQEIDLGAVLGPGGRERLVGLLKTLAKID